MKINKDGVAILVWLSMGLSFLVAQGLMGVGWILSGWFWYHFIEKQKNET